MILCMRHNTKVLWGGGGKDIRSSSSNKRCRGSGATNDGHLHALASPITGLPYKYSVVAVGMMTILLLFIWLA